MLGPTTAAIMMLAQKNWHRDVWSTRRRRHGTFWRPRRVVGNARSSFPVTHLGLLCHR